MCDFTWHNLVMLVLDSSVCVPVHVPGILPWFEACVVLNSKNVCVSVQFVCQVVKFLLDFLCMVI